jgi:methionyl-tRNA formyltransferase
LQPAKFTARQAYNRWRGFQSWPGCWGEFRGKRFLLHAIHPVTAQVSLATGELDASTGVLLLGMAEGTLLRLDEVQPEAKPRISGAQFARDYQLKAGERVE